MKKLKKKKNKRVEKVAIKAKMKKVVGKKMKIARSCRSKSTESAGNTRSITLLMVCPKHLT